MAEQKLYGMWSAVSKKFVYGIQEPSKTKARQALFRAIGKDAYKYRFEAKRIKSPVLEVEKRNTITQDDLNQIAENVIAILKHYGVVIQRYNSYSTKSIYLKFDYGVCNSLRISDHKGKKHLAYRYNITPEVTTFCTNLTKQGWQRHQFPLHDWERAVYKILDDREEKIRNYGLGLYKQFMYDNAVKNQDTKGFWQQAVKV